MILDLHVDSTNMIIFMTISKQMLLRLRKCFEISIANGTNLYVGLYSKKCGYLCWAIDFTITIRNKVLSFYIGLPKLIYIIISQMYSNKVNSSSIIKVLFSYAINHKAIAFYSLFVIKKTVIWIVRQSLTYIYIGDILTSTNRYARSHHFIYKWGFESLTCASFGDRRRRVEITLKTHLAI